MKRLYITLFCALLVISESHAQAPNWTVNSDDFENSMAIVAVIIRDGVELTNSNNMIGAFVGNELRGVANTSTTNSDNRQVAHLLVWSNTGGGETVTFQMYDTDADVLITSVNSLTFVIDGTQGTTTNPLVISDNNLPTAINLSINSINENLDIGTIIGQFSSTDTDAGAMFTYSLISGIGDDDNSFFTIDNDNLMSAAAFDFEANESFSILIQTLDNLNGAFSQQFTISVFNQNDVPTDISISTLTLNENVATGVVTGDFTTEDEDINDTFSYSLVTGNGDQNNDKFIIDGNQLKTNSAINFEDNSSLSIRIETKDNSNAVFSKPFVISINNLNDAPTEILLSSSSFDENQTIGTSIANISSTDEDTSDTHTYSFVSTGSNDNENFTITGSELLTKATFDFEGRITYFINLQTNDGNGSTFQQQLTLTVNDQNDIPTAIDISNTNIIENQIIGSVIGTLETTDQDSGDTFTYSLTSGTGDSDNGNFQVVDNEVQSNVTFDYETKNAYSIRIKTEDSDGGTFEKSIQIQIEDENDFPTDIILDNLSVPENLSLGILVGEFTTLDVDKLNTHFYSLTSGEGDTANEQFSISGNKLLTAGTFDFETKITYNIRLETNDKSGGTFQKSFVITIIDTNDDPTILNITESDIDENLSIGSIVGTFSITDVDPVLPVYSMIPGSNDNDQFQIDGNDLKSTAIFNFELRNQYFIDVLANDGAEGIIVKRFEISISDANDIPEDIYLNSVSVDENKDIGSMVGMFTTNDQDVSDQHTYSLVSGENDTDNSSFSLVDNELQTNEIFDFELKKSYQIRVRSTDLAGTFVEFSFTIQVLNANDVPTDIFITSTDIDEELPANSIIGVLSTTDEDIEDSFIYTLSSGDGDENNSEFDINNDILISKTVFDAETKTSYSIRVNVMDSGGNSTSKSFSISILPINESPEILDQIFSIEERSEIGIIVGTVDALDIDGDIISFSILDTSVPFEIDNLSGELSISNNVIDFEVTEEYNIEITVEDSEGLNDIALITILVEDVIESELPLPANDFISPNNDGYNDVFTINNISLYQGYTLTIYNNIGSEVYQSTDYQNNWSGVSNSGNDLASGVYYYLFNSSNNPVSFTGSLTLVR